MLIVFGKFIPNSLEDLYDCGMRGYSKFELQSKEIKKKKITESYWK